MQSVYLNSQADLAALAAKSKTLCNDICYIALRNLHFKEINPLTCGFQYCPPGHTEGVHIFDAYIVHYVVSGKGLFINAEGEHEVSARQCFIIKPGESHNYIADKNEPWHYIWTSFRGTIADALLSDAPSVKSIDEDLFEELKYALSYTTSREVYLIGCITKIIAEITNETHANNIIASIKNHINVNYASNPRVTDIAYSFGLSRNHLTRLFKEETGRTPQEYLLNRKMKEAKRFLSEGMNVNETAQFVGYSDYTTFSRAYKKFYGKSPSSDTRIIPRSPLGTPQNRYA